MEVKEVKYTTYDADNDLRAMALIESLYEAGDCNEVGAELLAGARIFLTNRVANNEAYYATIIASHDLRFTPKVNLFGQ